jgi:hypothetical protein
MPYHSAITFADINDKLERLKLVCPKCDRFGRYSVKRLILQYGRDCKIPDWIALMTKDCPRRLGGSLSDTCAARCPELKRAFGRPEPPEAA